MTKQLTLNERVERILNTEENSIWKYILDGNTDELLNNLPDDDESRVQNDIVTELFTDGDSSTLNAYDFETIKEGNSVLFSNMVRLVFALDINGGYEEIKDKVLDKLLDSMSGITDNIRKEAPDYPRKPMNALVWVEAAGMRSAMGALAYYFEQKDDIDHRHFAVMKRTGITLSIMGHYRHLVGPDMIEAAEIKELLDEPETAIGFYEAVVGDFTNEVEWFRETPEVGPGEEDVISLESLKKAYMAIDRLKGANEYAAQCAEIDEIIAREHFEVPDFSDDDDDDEDEE